MILGYNGKISIGDDFSLNAYSVLYGAGGLTIGNGVRIAAHVVIIPANHVFTDPDMPMHRQGLRNSALQSRTMCGLGPSSRSSTAPTYRVAA